MSPVAQSFAVAAWRQRLDVRKLEPVRQFAQPLPVPPRPTPRPVDRLQDDTVTLSANLDFLVVEPEFLGKSNGLGPARPEDFGPLCRFRRALATFFGHTSSRDTYQY